MKKMTELPLTIKTGQGPIYGELVMPDDAKAVILFAHGSGSSRFSPRNQYVAHYLNHNGFGTLLIDLLTHEEETEDRNTSAFRFDISLLSQRLVQATDWLIHHRPTADLKIGYFGASTGAAAALVAAPQYPCVVEAVVSRGGRPDLARQALPLVRVPVLLIVGESDPQVLELNQTALEVIGSPVKKLEVVPGATHLFEEPGKLADVAELSADWFIRYLVSPPVKKEGDFYAA